jgi:hypothetical protein
MLACLPACLLAGHVVRGPVKAHNTRQTHPLTGLRACLLAGHVVRGPVKARGAGQAVVR